MNNQEAQGRYDPTKLADLLEELRDLQELERTGFDDATLANLRFEPADDAEEEPQTGRVEITLVADAATFEAMEPRLDELVKAFDVETHVRRG